MALAFSEPTQAKPYRSCFSMRSIANNWAKRNLIQILNDNHSHLGWFEKKFLPSLCSG